MAKRKTNRGDAGQTEGGAAGSASGSESAEDRVIALAEQLGRIIGTVQAKAGGWMDREALMQQISQVRDGATHLLEQLGVAGTSDAANSGTGTDNQPASASGQQRGGQNARNAQSAQNRTRSQQASSRGGARGGRQQASAEAKEDTGRQNNRQTPRGRSGGAVDAPGKKHRKPVPNQVRANAADTGRLAKMKIVNANRRRGR